MTASPLTPAIEPVAWFEYARKKPTLKRLVFDRTSRSQLRVAGWVSEPLIKESDAQQARADLEAENQRLEKFVYLVLDGCLKGRIKSPPIVIEDLEATDLKLISLADAARAALEKQP